MRISKLMLLFTAGTLLAGTAACADDETDGGACVDYSGVSGSGSFKDDVMPIFQQSCNFSSCHSSAVGSPKEGLALGPENGTAASQSDIDAVHAGIVGASSLRSNLKLVEAGDPKASWLMAKVEYADFSACASNVCTDSATGCGQTMPVGGMLTAAQLTTLATWIAAGAPNN